MKNLFVLAVFLFSVNAKTFDFAKFMIAAKASGIKLAADSRADSPNGYAEDDGQGHLKVELYENSQAPGVDRPGHLGEAGRSALPAPIEQYRSVLQAAVDSSQ